MFEYWIYINETVWEGLESEVLLEKVGHRGGL